jgi:hypothetical protein
VCIDHDGWNGAHLVRHTQEPGFLLELTPDRAAPDRIGEGIIKRVCVPNSWAGDYGRYGRLLKSAQEFFARAQAGRRPVTSSGGARTAP